MFNVLVGCQNLSRFDPTAPRCYSFWCHLSSFCVPMWIVSLHYNSSITTCTKWEYKNVPSNNARWKPNFNGHFLKPLQHEIMRLGRFIMWLVHPAGFWSQQENDEKFSATILKQAYATMVGNVHSFGICMKRAALWHYIYTFSWFSFHH